MTYQTSTIKDLSIALEALSRINCEGSSEFYNDIADLLQQAISKTKKEFRQPDKDETSTTTNDDIPF